MNKNALVLFYTGNKPSENYLELLANALVAHLGADPDDIIIKHYDEESIANVVADDAIRKAVKEAKDEYKRPTIKIHVQDGKKTTVVKFVKELFGVSLQKAKEMVDNHILEIPACINMQSLITGLWTSGATICKGSDYAMEQAVYFIKKMYGDPLALVRAYAVAGYHNRVNAADEEEMALLNAVDILYDNPREASLQLSDDTLFQTILALKR